MSIALAFSGGLDTSFCVPYLTEETGQDVHTITVDTGGFSDGEKQQIEARATELGAASHTLVDARGELWSRVLQYLVKGNVRRGGVYPLCVGPERVVQAEALVTAAKSLGATAVAHGSTGAGNDQIRFDGALRLLADGLDVLTPIRSLHLSREASTAYLQERGFTVEAKTTDYSVNAGLWGTTIGGKETHRPDGVLPPEAWVDTVAPEDAPDEPREVAIDWIEGVPIAVDGRSMGPVALVEMLNRIGAEHGVGRGVHVGDTILGIKGRVAFEAPAAAILLNAHLELEKVVLTHLQLTHKAGLGDLYGRLVHEGLFFDPLARDLEAFLDSTQQRVTGTTTVQLYKGTARVLGANSRFSLFDAGARYGEDSALWDGRDAEGFARIYGIQGRLAAR
ncbi:MAG: argininosuccinate synthase, partial [Bacteroidota bacterium]